MHRNLVTSPYPPAFCRLVYRIPCLIFLLWCGTSLFAQSPGGSTNSVAPPSEIRVTHILGFESTPNNAGGKLSIQGDVLQFKKSDAAAVQITVASIQDVVVGEQDIQVGGVPMALGKAATPYAGGRVISLFSHKKYDTLALQYLDANQAWHGAIFRLAKGQAEAFKNQLVDKGAHVIPVENKTAKQSTPEVKNESK